MANESALAVKSGKVKARVLMDCRYGNCNDVVLLDAETAKDAWYAGEVDTEPAAVAYAESIPKREPPVVTTIKAIGAK